MSNINPKYFELVRLKSDGRYIIYGIIVPSSQYVDKNHIIDTTTDKNKATIFHRGIAENLIEIINQKLEIEIFN